MKVYVIEKGEYSDRFIVGVTDNPIRAEEIKKAVSVGWRGEASITEYDTEQFSDNRFRYRVEEEFGEWTASYDDYDMCDNYPESCHAWGDTYITYASSPEQAIKIAQDIKAQMKAEEEGVAL